MRNTGAFLSVILAAVFCFGGTVSAALSGAGTVTNPYLIQSRADFDAFANPANAAVYWFTNKYTKLMCDLDLSGTTYTQAVIAPTSGNPFTGVFNGNGHILSNVTINQPTKDYIGLFGYIGAGGQIRRLGVENVNLTGYANVGGLAGFNRGSITDCYATGSIAGSNYYVGGLAGRNYGSITGCYATASVIGTGYLGYVGGLAGGNNGSLAACYATGSVVGTGTGYVGGLTGYDFGYCGTDCFWDIETSGQTTSAGGTGKTTAEMKTLSTFTAAGWNISDTNGFDADWIISPDGQDYPKNIYFAYRGPSDTVPLSGEGTVQDPYQVGSPDDLVSVSQYSTVWAKHIILTADLDMDGFTLRPIGNSILRFTGRFDGQGFVIRNLTMNLPQKDYVGLFGYLGAGGEITRLGLEDINIAGKWYVGGLVGHNSKGTVSHCHTTGLAAGNSSSCVGGLAGFNFRGTLSNCTSDVHVSGAGATLGGLAGSNFSGGTITHCSATGAITDNGSDTFGSCIGGLVGNNYKSTITYCSAAGTVSATSASSDSTIGLGGLAGECSNDSTLSNCYATGAVHVTTTASPAGVYGGGLIGLKFSGTVQDCYSSGSVTYSCSAESDYFFGGLAGLTFAGSVTRCYSRGAVGSGDFTEADRCVGGLTGFNLGGVVSGSFWDIEVGLNAISGGGRGLTTGQMKSLSTYRKAGWADTGWVIANGQDYPHLVWEGTGGTAIPVSSAVALTGNGTAGNPYQIWTVQDFLVWGQYASVLHQHTRLMADLDFRDVLLSPVGDHELFTGVFDGNGHVIKNITISQPTNSFVGFFGRVGAGAVITDLGLKDVTIAGADHVGGLIGKNEGGTVSRCSTTGTVGGLGYVGGLIGSNEGGTFTACFSEAAVTAWNANDSHSYAGGLMGFNSSGTVRSCYAAGSVHGAGSLVGGLAGQNYGTLATCYATGFVSGNSTVGGLVGRNEGTLHTCYATGSVDGNSFVGGLAGWNAPNNGLFVTRCYWDTQTSGKTVGVGNGTSTEITGKSTAAMMTASTFGGWHFNTADDDPDRWKMLRPGEDYPRLAWQPIIAGDIAGLYGVAIDDLHVFVQQWLMDDCTLDNAFCGGADINTSGVVDLADFAALASRWPKEIDISIPMRGHWALDDAAGTVASDSSGNLRDGVLVNGPVWTSFGQVNGALQFDGVNDQVRITGYKGIAGTASRTCCAWIKPSAVTGEILTWGTDTAGARWIVRVNENGTLRAEVSSGYIYGTTVLTDGGWHHIAVALNDDGSPDISEAGLYVDGRLEPTGAVTPRAVNTGTTEDVRIGFYPGQSRYFNGLIDDVRLYGTALSGAQIEELFQTAGI